MHMNRILGIAPYEGMRALMEQLSAQRTDIALTAFVGDMESGAEIASRYTAEDFDVIISRGGTAEKIRAVTELPVIDIELSLHDLIRAMHLANSSKSRCALVGFPAITKNASFLCDVLGYQIELYTIHNESEARAVLQELSQNGCQMVLCDMITNSIAHEYGLPAVLIVSGSESIENAIRKAISTCNDLRPLRTRLQLLQAALQADHHSPLIYQENGQLVLGEKGDLPASVLERCQSWLAAVLQDGHRRFTAILEGRQYNVTGQVKHIAQEAYVVYSVKSAPVRLAYEKNGIRYMTREEVYDRYFHSFYGVTRPRDIQVYETYAKQAAPILIAWELGTGKDRMAQLMYACGAYQSAPICLVDCELLKDRGWEYLMQNEASPLMGSGNAIHFRHVSALPHDRYMYLFTMLRDTHFHHRNQLLFTASTKENGHLPAWTQEIISWFDCTLMELPLLKEHKEDIPQLAALYVSMLNTRSGKEIAGIEAEAIQLLQGYDWPANYDQFKRVLRELVMTAKGLSIRREEVAQALKKEEILYPSRLPLSFAEAMKGKTIAEADLMLAKLAIAEAGGNRTAAAERLGISRTSLWRMMQGAE